MLELIIQMLIILAARIPTDNIIHFLKPGKAQIATKLYHKFYFISRMSSSYLIFTCNNWLRYYVSIFQKSQTKIFKLFEKCHDLIDCPEVFTKIDCFPDIIFTNGICFLLAMYRASKQKLYYIQ